MPRIIMIDDDPDLVKIVKSRLKQKGYEVAVFTEWAQAANAIRSFNPQLILIDVFLEKLDGLDVCNKLKKSAFTRHIPIIVLSGYPGVEDSAIYEFGADEFLSKPFKMKELIGKIDGILSKRAHV